MGAGYRYLCGSYQREVSYLLQGKSKHQPANMLHVSHVPGTRLPLQTHQHINTSTHTICFYPNAVQHRHMQHRGHSVGHRLMLTCMYTIISYLTLPCMHRQNKQKTRTAECQHQHFCGPHGGSHSLIYVLHKLQNGIIKTCSTAGLCASPVRIFYLPAGGE